MLKQIKAFVAPIDTEMIIASDKARSGTTIKAAEAAITSAPTVRDALLRFREHYGLAHATYHLAQVVSRPIDAPFVRTTYPAEWVSKYLLEGLVCIDPVVQQGFLRETSFDWTELVVGPAEAPVLAEAAAFGVGPRGFSIPITDRVRRRALLSVTADLAATEWSDLTRRYREDWSRVALAVHKLAIREIHGGSDPVPALSRREVQSLYWTAMGKDNKDIAMILGLSEYTVRDYTKSARLKLGCNNLSAAVLRAEQLRIITPWLQSSPKIGEPS